MKISILITNFNKKKFISKTLKSCINQKYKNFEIIIVDDQSTDNSNLILKKYNSKYNYIKLYFKKGQKSKFPAINHFNAVKYGLKKCSGKIICLLAGDDVFDKKKLDYISNFFIKNPNSKQVFNKPKFYVNKNFIFPTKEYRIRFNKWPYHPPLSCINIKKNILLRIMNEYNNNKYQHLWLDFIISSVGFFQFNNFNMIDHFLTTYVVENTGYEKKLYSNYNSTWWKRRLQAHDFVNKIRKSIFYNKFFSLDFIVTFLLNNLYKFKIFKFK